MSGRELFCTGGMRTGGAEIDRVGLILLGTIRILMFLAFLNEPYGPEGIHKSKTGMLTNLRLILHVYQKVLSCDS